MTFAAEYFSHVISAALGFAAFCLLIKERDGPRRRPAGRRRAGLLAGPRRHLRVPDRAGRRRPVRLRPGTPAASDCALAPRRRLRAPAPWSGRCPMLAFNFWALRQPAASSPTATRSPSPASTGHDVLGLNSHGFFGITAPRFDSAVDLLFAGRGLLVADPDRRHGGRRGLPDAPARPPRARRNTILAVAAVYFVYNAGYWLPFGGGTPGPALPDPGAALPRDRTRLRLQATARAHPRPGDPLGAHDAGRERSPIR